MKKLVKNIKQNYKLVLIMLVSGLFLGWLIFHPPGTERTSETYNESHEGHDHSSDDPTTWTCSMHPQIKQDKPGQCPICAMDLIPLTTTQSPGGETDPDEIVLSESAARLADIQTIMVSKGTPQKSLFLQGKVQVDERNISELTSRYGGRIEKLFVNFTGQRVLKGEKLATIYSPDLVSAQRELLEALSFKESRPSYYVAARSKLKLWGLSDNQIDAIEKNVEPELFFDVLSPISGTVMVRHVSQGDYVKEGSALFQLTDLSRVWVMLDAYESDLPWIRKGDHVEITMQSLPGSTYEGKVTYIDPFINPSTRVAKVRIELPNRELKLKPEMFANGVLHSAIAESSDQLLIPKSSILWTGKRAVVYVRVPERESPSFLYREISLGPEAGDFYVVSDGLVEGETVAVNGVFKIDAAAQLEGKPSMMNPGGGRISTGHNHGGEEVIEANNGELLLTDIRVAKEFKDQLTIVYTSYLKMKDAFVDSDAKKASDESYKVSKVLDAVDMSLLEGEAHIEWMSQLESLKDALTSIQKTSDIAKQRQFFSSLNETFYRSLKAFGLSNITSYYQYCPMAFDDTGAYWFSDSEEIFNPYFGDAMLKCGETKEVIRHN
jgi:Cu(I)/Ag(I) efflux system membrane fusion protein